MSLQSFLKLLREEASSTLWSQAAVMARRNIFNVAGEKGEYQVRVHDTGQGLNPQLQLFVEDEDWVCDCHSDHDPCIHVLAATIAIKRNLDHGLPLPTLDLPTKLLHYKWIANGEQLQIQRYIGAYESGGQQTELTLLSGSLKSIAAGARSSATFLPDKIDLQIDQLIEDMKTSGNTFTRRAKMISLMQLLPPDRFLTELKPGDGTVFTGEINRESGGCRVKIKQQYDQVYKNGFAIWQNAILVLPDYDVLQEIVQFPAEGKFYSGASEANFLATTLPHLEKFVEFHSQTITRAEYQKPHIRLHNVETDSGISITPRIFYGRREPVAYVKNDQIQMIDRKETPPLRDVVAEQRLRDELWQNYRLNLNESVSLATLSDFKKMDGPKFTEIPTFGENLAKYSVKGRLIVNVEDMDSHDLPHCAIPGFPAFQVPLALVMQHFERGESLMKIGDLGLVEIPRDYLRANQHLLNELLDQKGQGLLGQLRRTLARDRLRGRFESPSTIIARYQLQTQQTILSEVLSKVQAELRHYQKDAVEWLIALRDLGCGALLADDMGLGKTLQAICCLQGRSLVVCPASLLANWQREIMRFRPDLAVRIYHGSQRRLDHRPDENEVVITSYGIARQDQTILSGQKWSVLVLDESQTIRNPDSQIFQAIAQFSAEWRMALSGTPIENKIDDLWAQMEILNPGYLGDRKSFISFYSGRQLEQFPERGQYLRQKIAPFIKRRMKSDVARELPPKTEYTRVLNMAEREREHYDAFLATVRREITGEDSISLPDILTVLLRLRQLCCHPALVRAESTTLTSTKHKYLLARVEELLDLGHKILIISQWTQHLDLVAKTLSELKSSMCRIDGSTPDRQAQVDTFQNDPEVRIMLMSLKAGGVGLNLTAADYVFILDPWWNPAAEAQAQDRAYRIGQDKPVFVERLVMRNTIEEGIIRLQERKRSLNFDVIEGLTGQKFNRNDFLELLAEI